MAMKPNPWGSFQEEGWVGQFSLFPEKKNLKRIEKIKEKGDLAPLLWRHTEKVGAVGEKPGGEKTPG